MSYCIRLAAGFLLAILAPSIAFAHGIGERYDLPVPLWLWLTGGGIAIAASFVIASVAVKRATAPDHEQADARKSLLGRFLVPRWLRIGAALCALLLLVLVVIAGFIGDQTPTRNIAPIMVWVISYAVFCLKKKMSV